MYYILSLERSGKNRRVWWKPHKMGYTDNIKEAGIYGFGDAFDIAMGDLGNDLPIEMTIVLSFEAVRSSLPTPEAPDTEPDSTQRP